jgi:hypothetical protein|tara:strand:- start:520 stop:1092 length:573 start_codon:yes stop_codon:yes gene_type:complete
MKRNLLLFSILFLFSLNLVLISAEVGVGISPSKIVEQIQSGEDSSYEFLVFNTGDIPIDIKIVVEGDIADFTTAEPKKKIVQPEPRPIALPIKNGETFIVTFNPPSKGKEVRYEGSISAIGTLISGSSFGGSVGVASKVELIVIPPKSIFAFITLTHWIIFGIIVLLILIFWVLKKEGLSISFKNKKKKK